LVPGQKTRDHHVDSEYESDKWYAQEARKKEKGKGKETNEGKKGGKKETKRNKSGDNQRYKSGNNTPKSTQARNSHRGDNTSESAKTSKPDSNDRDREENKKLLKSPKGLGKKGKRELGKKGKMDDKQDGKGGGKKGGKKDSQKETGKTGWLGDWLNYSKWGGVICDRFVACKTPLGGKFDSERKFNMLATVSCSIPLLKFCKYYNSTLSLR
jgi:hypothetical protein